MGKAMMEPKVGRLALTTAASVMRAILCPVHRDAPADESESTAERLARVVAESSSADELHDALVLIVECGDIEAARQIARRAVELVDGVLVLRRQPPH